ncbi:putative E3 ubiquitin-protein ligase UBR7 [Babylonia areolata]|uniref:putative E3 ubiquitin-protein ligase UBR7 n=1 Tax=Babylonia areolata TaxID=304850 RepID=UPI003FD623C2
MSAEDRPSVDDDDSVSMLEVLAQESRMQEDASAVLGGSDDQECTYAKGYIKRQALYACTTCSTTEPAGVCLACSYQCHEGHDLYELYTKRNFRCDCGNSKFKDNKCKLVPIKSDVNEENQYNQNFKGAYCICARPYPDPEDETEDLMIQCVVCEDWYHGRHLGTEVPENDSYQEMICRGCMAKHPFLWAYQVNGQAETVQKELGEDEKVDVAGGDSDKTKPDPMSQESTVKPENEEGVKEKPDVDSDKVMEQDDTTPAKAQKRKLAPGSMPSEACADGASGSSTSAESEPPSKQTKAEEAADSRPKSGIGSCLLQDLRKRQFTVKDCGTFWLEGWREKLCACDACVSMYKEEGVAFLTDVTETVSTYEEKGRSNPAMSDLEQERSLLSGMDRIQQIEMINGFNDLKSELSDFLKTFAESGKVVSSDDIKGFFAHMEKRKKERMSGMQYFCK